MVKRIIATPFFFALVLLLSLIALATVSHAAVVYPPEAELIEDSGAGSLNGQEIDVTILIVRGSAWDDKDVEWLINDAISQAFGIWGRKAGVRLCFQPISKIDGKSSYLAPDLQKLAEEHEASAKNIVCVFADAGGKGGMVLPGMRGYANERLVQNNTPVILISREVLKDPGTNRDLAHELGHVLTRSPKHEYEWFSRRSDSNVMSQSSIAGDDLTLEQIKKAQRYPDITVPAGEDDKDVEQPGVDDERIPWEVESVNDDIKYYRERQAEANRLLSQDKADLERWQDRKSRYLERENPDPETIKDYEAWIKSHEQTIDSLEHDLARYNKRLEELEEERRILRLKQAAGEGGEDTEEGSGVSTSLDVTGDYSARLQQKQKQEDISAQEDIERVRKEREVEIQLAIKRIEAWAEIEKGNATWQEVQNKIAGEMAKAAREGKDRGFLRSLLRDLLRIGGTAFFGKLGYDSAGQVVEAMFPSDSAEEVISAPATSTPTATSGLSDITVNTTPITLFMWDHATEDGDRINIYLNGSIVRRNITITNAKQQVVLMVRLGSNEVAIKALNQGSVGPNTAAITITGVVKGKKSQQWDLKTGQVGRMRIWYQQR